VRAYKAAEYERINSTDNKPTRKIPNVLLTRGYSWEVLQSKHQNPKGIHYCFYSAVNSLKHINLHSRSFGKPSINIQSMCLTGNQTSIDIIMPLCDNQAMSLSLCCVSTHRESLLCSMPQLMTSHR
jgi:hypothetical protein